jgi:phage-related protein
VLHCFQKKSKAGIKTPMRDLELIRRRLAEAEIHFRNVIEREE